MRTTLTNRSGKTIGYVQEVSLYRVAVQDTNGKTLGFYNPHLNQTFTASGQMIGHGNLLTSLLANLVSQNAT